MNKKKRISNTKLISSCVITILFIGYYFTIVWLSFSEWSNVFKPLMNFNFFMCEVVFILITIFIAFRKLNLIKKLNFKMIFFAISVFLIAVYILAYYEIQPFNIIGSVFIYIGLLLSGSILFLFKKNEMKERKIQE